MDENSLDRNADDLLGNLLHAQSGAESSGRPDPAAGETPEVAVTVSPKPGAPVRPPTDSPPPTTVVGQPPASHGAPFATQGEWIGRYRLLQEIGEGGFGVVWEAEQRDPVRRRVALKIIKLGMDTREVVARFEAERQALALMDHPNIARVLDGGATESGRPYFVMELVAGVPLTTYCDTHKLSVPERLSLFILVCQAVQHAHHKGVIHRDIKPSNVLVSRMDGKAVPKIIDFGIARATSQQLTEKTLFTQLGQLIGTPEYMSPEQAGLSGLDVDTRTDIYSLGVVLYELLTGETPLDRRRLRRLAFAEIQRAVCDEEPPRPSTRVSTLGASITDIAARRHIDPQRLGRTLRGDLDWIVMRALEKDRARRYETADGLALDVQRYLDKEPVAAGPPSVGYRVRKFVSRNRTTVIVGTGVVVMLVAATAVSVWQAVRATVAGNLARERLEEINKQQKIAVEAMHRAEAAREDAEDLISFLLTDLKNALAPIGRVDLMRGIGEIVQDYYAHEGRSEGGAASMLRRAQALGVLASVAESTGRAEDAVRLNASCIQSLEKWIETHGRKDEVLRTLAEAHERQAQFMNAARWGRAADGTCAEVSLRAAVNLLQELRTSREATIDDKWHLVQLMLQDAQQLRALGKTDESASLLLEAIRLGAAEERRSAVTAAGRLTKAFLASEAVWTHVADDSIPREWREVLRLPSVETLQPVREVLRETPDDQRLREQLWCLVSWPGTAHAFPGKDAMIRLSVDLSTELMTRDSNNLLWAERAAQSLERLSEIAPEPEAGASHEKSIEILEYLVRRQPWSIALKERLCGTCSRRAAHLASTGDSDAARQRFKRALDLVDELGRELDANDASSYAAQRKAERAAIVAALERLKDAAPR